MPDFKYQRDTNRMFCLGMDLNRPVDSLKQLKWARLKNVRTYQIGRIEPRPGLTLIGTVDGSVHSIRRLNVPRTGAWTRFIGSADNLSMGTVAFTEIDDGYSSNPLALVPYRPPQSADPWMYIMDSSRQRKSDIDGNLHFVGLPPPTTAPIVTRQDIKFKSLLGPILNISGWTNGPAFVSAFTSNFLRVDTTITAILYDDTTTNTGWCTIQPASVNGITEGMDLQVGSGGNVETVLVHTVHGGNAATSTTIADILFISGTDGECSIIPTTQLNGVTAQGLLYNQTQSSYARITALIEGPDDTWCVHCSTPSGSTWVAGDTIYFQPSFRTYTQQTRAAGNDLDSVGLQSGAGSTGDASLGLTGYIWSPVQSPAIDMSNIATGVPSTGDDYLYISGAFTKPDNLAEARVMFSSSTNDVDPFENDYFYRSFVPADFVTPARLKANPVVGAYSGISPYATPQGYVAGSDGTGRFAVPRGSTSISTTVDASGNPSTATYTVWNESFNATETSILRQLFGRYLGSAWGLLRFRVGDLARVGNPDLSNIRRIGLEFTVIAPTDDNPTPQCAMFFGSFILTGGYGLDVDYGPNILYRYRARCSTTGVVSNWGPPTRESFYVRRERLQLEAPAQYTLAAEADYIDFQRRGAALPDGWYYVGSLANEATPLTMIDRFPDDVIVGNPSEDQIHYQLWPTLGTPVTGETVSVCGQIVNTNAVYPFSTTWAPQTVIQIGGIWYTVYRVNSTTQLELYENAGSHVDDEEISWLVSEPILAAQTLPCFWGPLGETFFSCGDLNNPQRLYWTNVGSADDTQLRNWLDITSPSEPLMNGVIYNGRSYAWSSERFFQILPAGQDEAGATVAWTYVEIPNGKGLFGRWSFTGVQSPPGYILYWLGREGIYATDGSSPRSITDEDLRPIFPSEGNLGEAVNGVEPPNIIESAAAQHRLAYIDDYLYYDYATTAYTAPDPITGGGTANQTGELTDSLNYWGDSVAVSGGAGPLAISVGLTDAMPTMYDSIAAGLTTKGGSVGTSDLNNWADSVSVTLTT